jgi:hypothetical protein
MAFKLLLVVCAALTLAGCELIGAVFEVGVWVGVMIVLAILALIGAVIGRLRK